MNFIELDPSLGSFIKLADYKYLFQESVSMHSWVTLPISEVLTQDGVQWLDKNNFTVYKEIAILFKTPINFEGPFHIEGLTTNEYAINFVLDGGGAVEWTDNELEESHRWNGEDGSRVILYKKTPTTLISSRWSSSVALINIAKKHRVISYVVPRYAISIRMETGSYPRNFEHAAELLTPWIRK